MRRFLPAIFLGVSWRGPRKGEKVCARVRGGACRLNFSGLSPETQLSWQEDQEGPEGQEAEQVEQSLDALAILIPCSFQR